MPSTSLGLPYPAASDAPDGPAGFQALAAATNQLFLDRDVLVVARRTTVFTFTSDVSHFIIPFNEELLDRDGAYDPSTGAWTAPRNGWVNFKANGHVNISAAADLITWISVCQLTAGGAFSAVLADGLQVSLPSASTFASDTWGLKVDESVQVASGTKYGIGIRVSASGATKTLVADGLKNQFSVRYESP